MLKLQSENYELRSLVPSDAERDWGAWGADPDTAVLLNSRPRELSVAERVAYIARFDHRTSYLLGIFERTTDELVGIWAVYTDPGTREFLINVLVGPKNARKQGAWSGTRGLVQQHFFETAGMETCRCTVVGRNAYMSDWLLKHAWVLERTSRKTNPVDGSEVEIHRFGLTRQAWRRREAERKEIVAGSATSLTP
ncbi:MAG: GNAT family protein [Alphaproteobacteria bacterium]|nr:GNAT family protein [Alphaproteobacteria bacterium]